MLIFNQQILLLYLLLGYLEVGTKIDEMHTLSPPPPSPPPPIYIINLFYRRRSSFLPFLSPSFLLFLINYSRCNIGAADHFSKASSTPDQEGGRVGGENAAVGAEEDYGLYSDYFYEDEEEGGEDECDLTSTGTPGTLRLKGGAALSTTPSHTHTHTPLNVNVGGTRPTASTHQSNGTSQGGGDSAASGQMQSTGIGIGVGVGTGMSKIHSHVTHLHRPPQQHQQSQQQEHVRNSMSAPSTSR